MPKFQRIYWSKKFDWKHYSKLYNKYCKLKGNYYTQSANVLLKFAKLKPNSRIVDLACGTGALTRQILIKKPRAQIFAIDLSKDMAHYYRKNFLNKIKNKKIEVVCGNAEKINKYTKGPYDTIFISSALWDLELNNVFKNLAKVLKKNGLIIFNLPSLVVEKEKGFIFFIEHFFRQTLNSKMIYRRIKTNYLKSLFKKNGFSLVKIKEYSFKMSKKNVAHFFNLLKYRYPFILFPKETPYRTKLKKCAEIFKESLKYIPKEGIDETGFIFVIKKN